MSAFVGIFVTDLLPVFLIAALGFLVARFGKADVATLTRVVFFVLLPAMVFHMLVTSSVTGGDVGRLAAAATLIIAALALVGAVLAKILRLSRTERAAFLLVVMFSNGGNYGLPVLAFAFGPDALAHGTVFFLTGAVLTYVVGGLLAAAGRRSWLAAAGDVLKMPVLYTAVLGLIVKATGTTVPLPVMRPVTLLSGAALPVMILILGMQLERAGRPAQIKALLTASATSLFVSPLVAIGVADALGLTGPARQAAVLLSAMPVAVTTTILALEYGVEPDFVTGAVFVTTLLSPLTLVPLIHYLG